MSKDEDKDKDKDKEKMVSERTVTYRGFKDAEEAKKFLDDMRGEMAKTWRSFDRIFEGTKRLLDTVFRPYSVDDEIDYHQQLIKRLEEKKKLMLPDKEEKEE